MSTQPPTTTASPRPPHPPSHADALKFLAVMLGVDSIRPIANLSDPHTVLHYADDDVGGALGEALLAEGLGIFPNGIPAPGEKTIGDRRAQFSRISRVLWVGPSAPSEMQRDELERELGYVIEPAGLIEGRAWWRENVLHGPKDDAPGTAYDLLAASPSGVIVFPGPVPIWLLAEIFPHENDAGGPPPNATPVLAAQYSAPDIHVHPDSVHAPRVNTGLVKWQLIGYVFPSNPD